MHLQVDESCSPCRKWLIRSECSNANNGRGTATNQNCDIQCLPGYEDRGDHDDKLVVTVAGNGFTSGGHQGTNDLGSKQKYNMACKFSDVQSKSWSWDS